VARVVEALVMAVEAEAALGEAELVVVTARCR